jgi:hypothetical protein
MKHQSSSLTSGLAHPDVSGVHSLFSRIATVCFVSSAVGTAMVIARMVADPARAGFHPVLPDAIENLRLAKVGPLGLGKFWYGSRSLLYPLFLWLTGANTQHAVLFQALMYFGAVLFLASTVARFCRTYLFAGISVVLVVSVTTLPTYSQWSINLLPESLSMTVSLLLIALWMRFVAWPTQRRAVGAAIATTAWASARNGNAGIAVFGSVLFLVGLGLRMLVRRWTQPPASCSLEGTSTFAFPKLLVRVVASIFVLSAVTYVFQQHRSTDLAGTPSALALAPGESTLAATPLTHNRGLGELLTIDWAKWNKSPPTDSDTFQTFTRWPSISGHSLMIQLPPKLMLLIGMLALFLAAYVCESLAGRRVVQTLFLLGGIAFAELAFSFFGSITNPYRATIAAQFRLELIALIAVVIAADQVVLEFLAPAIGKTSSYLGRVAYAVTTSRPNDSSITTAELSFGHQPRRTGAGIYGVWISVASGSLVLLAAIFKNEYASQDWDPQYMRDIVERTRHFGGSYYVNGIHNKGPLEPLLYHAAAIVTRFESFWFAISIFVALSALSIAVAVYTGFKTVNASAQAATSAACAGFIHFTLTEADYSGKLYSRNMAIGLLALVCTLTFSGAFWKKPATRTSITGRKAAVIAGIALGLSAQTVSTTALTCAVLGVAALFLMRTNRGRVANVRQLQLTLVLSAFLTFISAPIYYAARGVFRVYWLSWWVYGQFMTAATGQSLRRQLARGWHDQWIYYRARPIMTICLGVFVVVTLSLWKKLTTLQRVLHLTLTAWFLTSSVEIMLTQRNSSHYYSVSALPLAIIAAITAAHVLRMFQLAGSQFRFATFSPAIVMMLTVVLSGSRPFFDGLRGASTFKGTDARTAERMTNRDGETRVVQATFDLVTENGDPLWAWTNEPWPYLNYHRVSASRFIWNSFLLGQVYLGRTSKDYILPGSQQWLAADLRTSKPAIYVEPVASPMPETEPSSKILKDTFTDLFTAPKSRVKVRSDVLNKLIQEHSADTTWRPPQGPTGVWNIGPNGLTSQQSLQPAPEAEHAIRLTNNVCQRIDGVLAAGAAANFAIRFDLAVVTNGQKPLPSLDYSPGRTRITVSGATVTSGDDSTAYLNTPSHVSQTAPTAFTILIGRRSAAVVIDGAIRGVIPIPRGALTNLETKSEGVSISGLKISHLTNCQRA